MRRFPLPSVIDALSFLVLMAALMGGLAVAPGLDAGFAASWIAAQ